MKLKNKVLVALGVLFVVCATLFYIYILPVAKMVSTDMQAYETRVAIRDDYTLHTTPLTKDVVEDICVKLEIKATSENCRPDAVVYAPDFFDEIKIYFRSLPDEEKTYSAVQDKLGDYLVFCGESHPSGHYRCRYDLRGDKRYPVFFWFDKDNFYYEIIATIGGS